MFVNISARVSKGMLLILLVLIMVTGMAFAQVQEKTVEDPEEHTTKVSAQIIPIFAVDSQGDPVYDLEESDIDFLVNGKPFPIASFSKYKIHSRENGLKQGGPGAKNYPKRYIFIITDTVFNSTSGLKRSRSISEKIVENASPGDVFIILENTSLGGLRYIIGPEKDKKKLTRALKGISQQSDRNEGLEKAHKELKRKRSHIIGFRDASRTGVTYTTNPDGDLRERQLMNHRIQTAKFDLQQKLKNFSHALASLQYALRTITASKIVYLISEGIPLGVMKGTPGTGGMQQLDSDLIFYFDYLKRTAKAINYGGSMFYVVNPSRIQYMGHDDNSGKDSLKYIAEESGGQYFGGSDVNAVVEQVERSTAAYYELIFIESNLAKNKLKFNIKCKKKGVKIHSIRNSEKQKPYHKMKKLQKEIFALNIVTGGSWSRMVGEVLQVKYKKIKSSGKTYRKVEVPIPQSMKGRQSDVFFIHLDPLTMQAEFELVKRKLKEKEPLKIRIGEEKNHYFAIIEPQATTCIYNRVK